MTFYSDEDIALKLKAEFDPVLFAELTERHSRKILRKTREYVKDEDVAKDLSQEILIKLFLKINSYKGENKFSAWLSAIIHNASMDYLRKSRQRFFADITEELADSVEDISELDEEIPMELSMEILQHLLEQIPPEDKMILLLKYNEKSSIKDIQTALGISESAVKMRLKRAREKVTKLHEKLKN